MKVILFILFVAAIIGVGVYRMIADYYGSSPWVDDDDDCCSTTNPDRPGIVISSSDPSEIKISGNTVSYKDGKPKGIDY